jgi:hypothetical protein
MQNMVTRRTFLQATGVGAFAPHLLGRTHSVEASEASAQPQAASKPNILFVLMDNLGYGEPGCYGGGALRGAPTPRIDTLATEGTRLTNFNVEAQCTPSRVGVRGEPQAIPTNRAWYTGSVPTWLGSV